MLAVEDAGDLGVGVVDGQPADQVDGVLVCADLGGLAPDRHGQLADRAAFPPQQQVRPALGVVAVDVDSDFLQQSAQQSCDHLHYQPFRFDHGSISNRWHGLADPLHAPLRQLSMPAPAPAEELPHFCRRSAL